MNSDIFHLASITNQMRLALEADVVGLVLCRSAGIGTTPEPLEWLRFNAADSALASKLALAAIEYGDIARHQDWPKCAISKLVQTNDNVFYLLSLSLSLSGSWELLLSGKPEFKISPTFRRDVSYGRLCMGRHFKPATVLAFKQPVRMLWGSRLQFAEKISFFAS